MADEPVSAIRNEYVRAYNLHNADSVLALYADDAVLLSEAGVFRGKSEIRKWLQIAFDQGSILETITATREKSADAIAYGTGQTRRLVGQEVHLGRYLIVLEKRRGKWLIVEHASLNVHMEICRQSLRNGEQNVFTHRTKSLDCVQSFSLFSSYDNPPLS